MLKVRQANLYQRLKDYPLDDPTHEFGFTRHLIKNHGWTPQYAERAIAEYKKFLFLTVVADHQIVPSDSVDQVWHAHLLMTESYWEDFCPHVLGQKLHHHPARGGYEEREEFHGLYHQTIQSYRLFFGSPPTDIWSPTYRRFSVELKGQRVNRAENWVIPKRWPKWKPSLGLCYAAIAIIWISLVLCDPSYAVASVGKKSLLYNPEILVFLALISGLSIRYIICCPSGQMSQHMLTPYQIAYLAGKQERVMALAMAQLVNQGYVRPNLHNRTFSVQKPLPLTVHPIEKEVFKQVTHTPEFKDLVRFFPASLHTSIDVLKQKKLIFSGGAETTRRSFQILFGLVLFLIALGELLGHEAINVDDLMTSYCVGILFTLPAACTDFRTRWGSKKLWEIAKTHDAYDLSQSVALYGHKAMSGGQLDVLQQIYRREEEEAASSCGCGC